MRCKRGCYWFCALALVFVVGTWAEELSAATPSEYLASYDRGYDQGYGSGYPIGYDDGYGLGSNRGTNEGTADGETEGYDDGWDAVYDPAYEVAFAESLPFGKVDGYADAFPTAVAEGYQWASELHQFLVHSANVTLTNAVFGRWGDPSGWGRPGGVTSLEFIMISTGAFGPTDGSILITDISTIDWSAYYFDEGYDEGYGIGYGEGKSLGDQKGFDEAYPLAYEAAYEPAFDLGSKEGTFQAIVEGGKNGYDSGWAEGLDVGEADGFTLGADLYVAGGSLTDLDPSGFVAAYASQQNLPSLAASESAVVPEPTALALSSIGLMLLLGQSCKR